MKNQKYASIATRTKTAPTGGVVGGKPVILDTRLQGFAGADTDAGEKYTLHKGGVYELDKQASLAISEGNLVYWDASANSNAGEVDKTNTNVLLGEAYKDAGASDTKVLVEAYYNN